MAQPTVQQPALSPPLSPSGHGFPVVKSPVSELNGKTAPLRIGSSSHTNGDRAHHFDESHKDSKTNGTHKDTTLNGHGSKSKPQPRPSSATNGVSAANHPSIAQAPGASFSVATKPQDRDPSLLRQPPQPSKSSGFDSLSGYHLDHNGRIPASEYNYIQRDKLVLSALRSARSSGNLHWIALMDLSNLASQHHMSPYSVMKFGPLGSPFAYIPITLQQPEVVRKTLERQRGEEMEAKRWLIEKRKRRLGVGMGEELPVLKLSGDMFKGVNGTKRPASLTTSPEREDRARSVLRTDVEKDLNEAMNGTLPQIPRSTSPTDDLLAPPSREASSSDEDAAVTPAKNGQEADLSNRMVELKTSQQGKGSEVADELMTSSAAGSNVEVGGPMDKERTMAQEMEEATASDKPAHPTQNSGVGPLDHGPPADQVQAQQTLAMKTSDTHPIHISPILPDHLLGEIGSKLHQLKLGGEGTSLTAATEEYFDQHSEEQVKGRRLIRLRSTLSLPSITSSDPSSQYLSQSQLAAQNSQTHLSLSNPPSPYIGNLLLSSCPGKKVRLSGPVRGRGAICRDLGLDLHRIYSIGVRAVVCCLNDEELSYLGAPWEEYEREADRLGLEVYRLPMAEGFAPTNVQEMDAALTSVVEDCTLKGTNVLVHCRGGVGRAGLIACGWLLKMGFVGDEGAYDGRRAKREGRWSHAGHAGEEEGRLGGGEREGRIIEGAAEIVHRTTASSNGGVAHPNEVSSNGSMSAEEEEQECTEILETVRSLIETIRRRRSPKAIETAEQVRFLVEYVTYLHRQERLRGAASQS